MLHVWTIEEQRRWVLDGDARMGNPVELWIGDVQVIQANGTNPKVVALDIQESLLMGSAGISESVSVYRCRIVRADSLEQRLDPKQKWELLFPGRTERVRVYPRGAIAETQMVGLGWEMILEAR